MHTKQTFYDKSLIPFQHIVYLIEIVESYATYPYFSFFQGPSYFIIPDSQGRLFEA